ncbi:class I SAM-dependent methyltransferase [Paracraurococcus lichenis]|uniref:Class I SAM-dependent methyltransferase n=1 Tax=Paracraurococcus lichenis TaxID=3064888 RepID=A0ABT9E7P3_9PROT|nr:class I SAM-dependent methyltransferase [Paracraurococcus sp. LOR1-02]MDO9712226.1 class I SAM-dependent methyltransferase [Paracraurococcus sp. LOR1-02]
MSASSNAAQKFDPARANEYQAQSRIALAGYDACHELSACMLTATLGAGSAARVLVLGAGGGAQEIVTAGRLEPNWRFTAVDPSAPMMDIARANLEQKGLAARTDIHLGYVDDLAPDQIFDAATLIGVLHHQPGEEAKRQLLRSVASRLRPGAPLILAGNRYAYTSQPLLLAAWGERWRMQGAMAEEVQAKLGKILEGADPPASEEVVAELLADAGFEQPTWFFSSLFWGACLAKRATTT